MKLFFEKLIRDTLETSIVGLVATSTQEADKTARIIFHAALEKIISQAIYQGIITEVVYMKVDNFVKSQGVLEPLTSKSLRLFYLLRRLPFHLSSKENLS